MELHAKLCEQAELRQRAKREDRAREKEEVEKASSTLSCFVIERQQISKGESHAKEFPENVLRIELMCGQGRYIYIYICAMYISKCMRYVPYTHTLYCPSGHTPGRCFMFINHFPPLYPSGDMPAVDILQKSRRRETVGRNQTCLILAADLPTEIQPPREGKSGRCAA